MTDHAKNPNLKELFCGTVLQMANELADCAKDFRAAPVPPEASRKAYNIAHSLHGAGTMYGFPQVSEMGASLEKMVKALGSGRLAPGAAVVELVDACAKALRDLVDLKCDDEESAAAISRLTWKCECAVHESDTTDDAASEQVPPPPD